MSMSQFTVDSSLELNDHASDNHSFSPAAALLPFHDRWILSIFIACSVGLLCTIVLSFVFICLSIRRFNGHFLLTNLFICFSVCFMYLTIIIFLLRANELFCGLREFLAQLAYALLFSALLCRYIMQWLGSRILSKRTKQLTSLLIYLLLVFIQVPVGILWWYFTIPRLCHQRKTNVFSSTATLPHFRFHFHKPSFAPPSTATCTNRCLVDYRFYATFTYAVFELVLCTLIAACLFLCRHCHRNRLGNDREKNVSINGNNALLTFFNMFAFILIDLVWLAWTCIYYFTHPFFIFPALIAGMFVIATVCLLFILLPQIYYYSKLKVTDVAKYKSTASPSQSPVPGGATTTLYSNRLASNNETNDQESLLQQKPHRQKRKQQTLSNGSEISYELGSSGTFLPITRTPKGPFKVKSTDKAATREKLNGLTHSDSSNTQSKSTHPNESMTNEIKATASSTDMKTQPSIAPLQRQLTSSSIASDFVTPAVANSLLHRSDPHRNHNVRSSSAMFYSPYPARRHDETIIPILCNTERPRTSTPVQMRLLVNSPSSSVPTTRRIQSGTDLRYVRHPYPSMYPPAAPAASPYYSSPSQQQYLFVDPYRTEPSRLGGNTWHSVLLQPGAAAHRYPYPPRRFHAEYRSLSQRLWDIDSGDDDDEAEEDIIKVTGRATPEKAHRTEFAPNRLDSDDQMLLHIDDDTEEDSYGKQYAHV